MYTLPTHTLNLKVFHATSSALLVAKRADQQLRGGRALLVLDLERSLQELRGLRAAAVRQVRAGVAGVAGAAAADLEDGLQLRAVRVRVAAGHHLDDQAAEGPDVGLLGVGGLAHDLGRHPEDGALEGRARSWAAEGSEVLGACGGQSGWIG